MMYGTYNLKLCGMSFIPSLTRRDILVSCNGDIKFSAVSVRLYFSSDFSINSARTRRLETRKYVVPFILVCACL